MARLIDLSGHIFNGITVESRAAKDSTNKTTWNCICHCGNRFEATGLNLKSGNTKSCGCRKNKPARLDITGQQFNKLTAISIAKVENYKVSWLCNCDCGNTTIVSRAHLVSGHTKSCGCHSSEVSRHLAIANLGGKKEKHPRWRFDLTEEDRNSNRLNQLEWSRAVLKRDGFRCVKCCSGKKLHAHHLTGYAKERERRSDVTNGVALCQACHKEFHSKYGTAKFTRANFFDWMGAPDPGDFSIVGEPSGLAGKIIDLFSDGSISALKEAVAEIQREIRRRELLSQGDAVHAQKGDAIGL